MMINLSSKTAARRGVMGGLVGGVMGALAALGAAGLASAAPGFGATVTGGVQLKGTIGAGSAHAFSCKGGDPNATFAWDLPLATLSCAETISAGQSFSLQLPVQTGTWTSASSDLLLTFGDSASTFTGSASSVTLFSVAVTTADLTTKHLVGTAKATWKADGSTPAGSVEATFDVTFP